nr:MAG TPA: NADH-ubiquinone oxidoreductase [Bacteriophage sp.]DAQ14148.1 MAG TPA: NADH-ubiquinone oxidoreductase [Bacteriophage sp.]
MITTVDSANDMAVREKRAVRRCESCRKCAILKSCRFGIRSPVRLFHI